MVDKKIIIKAMKENKIYELKDKFVEILSEKLNLIENGKVTQKDFHNLKSFFNMIGLYDIADICAELEYNIDEYKVKNIISVIYKVIDILKDEN